NAETEKNRRKVKARAHIPLMGGSLPDGGHGGGQAGPRFSGGRAISLDLDGRRRAAFRSQWRGHLADLAGSAECRPLIDVPDASRLAQADPRPTTACARPMLHESRSAESGPLRYVEFAPGPACATCASTEPSAISEATCPDQSSPASRRPRRATSILAARAPRSSTGSTRNLPAAGCCCASRPPTAHPP